MNTNPTKFLPKAAILAGCIALALVPSVRADDDNEQGGDISGSEHTQQHVPLVAATDAPAGVGGKAELEAENEDGLATANLVLEPKGLPDGTYTVSVTTKSDPTAAPVVLGSFTVSSSGGENDDSGHDGQVGLHEVRHQAENEQGDDGEESEVKFGDEGTPFPDGFNPFDIATVSITDQANVVDLTGDFTAVGADLTIHANVSVTPGPGATSAKGRAVLTARARRGKVRSLFILGARNVPANATFTVQVNDTAVGSVHSNRKGQVRIHAPKGLPGGQSPFQVHSVTLVDDAGTHIVDVNF